MANKPRILIIGPRGLFGCEGGIEKFSDEFIPRALKVADITVLCLAKPEVQLPPGLEVMIVPKSRRFKTDKAMYLLYALYLHAMRRYDHIFIFGTNFAMLVPLLKMVFWHRPKIHLRSGSIDHVLTKWGPFMRAIMRTSEGLTRYADTVIAVAPSIREHLQTLGIEAQLVRNGLNPGRMPELSQREKNTMLAVGRVTSQKNYEVLIEASNLLGAEGPEIAIIGGADLSDEYTRLKNLLMTNAQAKINFLGFQSRDKVMNALEHKSLYINCSMHEGMSNAVLEAIQSGIPIILSDIDANRDLGLPDRFYFSPHDPVALAKKIREALSDLESYIVPPETFEDWDRVVGRILQLTEIAA